jgi:hypothetical protein
MDTKTGQRRRLAKLAMKSGIVASPGRIYRDLPAESPGNWGFSAHVFMDAGLLEKEWWWTQSRANPSPPIFPVKQGKNREYRKINPN